MKSSKKASQLILISVLVIIAITLGAGVGFLAWIIKTTPDVSHLSSYKFSETSTIYSADNQVLAQLYIENRKYVPLSKMPMDLQNAIIATEDQKFWEHNGINIWAILRAIYVDIKTMSAAEGASTITQQLARNLALSQKKSLIRKIQEAYIAIQLERMYTKEEILEMYINQNNYGHYARGIQTAAEMYFGKDVNNLNLAESALLAGIPQLPNRLSPYKNMNAAIERRNTVLNRMVSEGYISEELAERAKKEEIKLAGLKQGGQEVIAPYFVRYVRDKVIQMFGSDMVYKGGLKIYTTLDTKMQKAADDVLQAALDTENGYLPTIDRKKGEDPIQPQIALISIDPRMGYIKAMIGGRGNDKFNRAIQSTRQPGSAFKPIVYTAALEAGYSPGDVVDDVLSYFDKGNPNPWPTNYNDKYLGPIPLRYSLAHSVNVATVRLLNEIGIDSTLTMAERLQISTIVREGNINDRNLGFALGGLTKGVSPIELASAYGIFANKGIYVEPQAILKIEDSEGHILYEADPVKKIVLEEDIAYLITDMLQSVVNGGTGWRAHIKGQQIAGKTGTTSDFKDAWFIGYTPDIVTSVWLGEDSPRTMTYDERDENGDLLFSENGQPMKISSGEATRLWGEYMRSVLEGRPAIEFEKPNNIITVSIDPITGKLPNQFTPNVVSELYREENEPTELDELHQPTVQVAIDSATNQLATSLCPPDQIVKKKFQKASGIQIGSASLTYNVKFEGEEKRRKIVYDFKDGVPVIKIDPKTGVPITDVNGNYLYQYMPTEKCAEHAPNTPLEVVEDGAKRVIDTIWNFFKSDDNQD
ncbi:MAG: PBP1A family penicillin-binding protein [Halanaerobiales bacterium]|nr:PBP1A family penicillin-binding protein [Halanaerobiales bacterium]